MKVYLRADENKAGVTVENASGEGVVLVREDGKELHCCESEARAVVEGLLRRMLERETRTYEISVLEAAIAVAREGR